MSRSWLPGERDQWRMFCDVCFGHDPRTFPKQPDLTQFHAEGWFIGSRVDACPRCVAAGKFPADTPHRFFQAADQ